VIVPLATKASKGLVLEDLDAFNSWLLNEELLFDADLVEVDLLVKLPLRPWVELVLLRGKTLIENSPFSGAQTIDGIYIIYRQFIVFEIGQEIHFIYIEININKWKR